MGFHSFSDQRIKDKMFQFHIAITSFSLSQIATGGSEQAWAKQAVIRITLKKTKKREIDFLVKE